MALSSGNIGKYNFLTSGEVLPEESSVQKSCNKKKRFEYSTLGSEFPKKQYQELKKVYELDKNEGDNMEV